MSAIESTPERTQLLRNYIAIMYPDDLKNPTRKTKQRVGTIWFEINRLEDRYGSEDSLPDGMDVVEFWLAHINNAKP
jgi:hypothetical protein